MVIATATETKSTPSAFVEATVPPTPMGMESATAWTTVWVTSTTVESAMAQEPSMTAVAQRSQMVIATAMETKSTPSAFVEATVPPTPMRTASVTTLS
jgi:hypothetical protein